mmetsp:Transcript_29580/g.53745  ORF Transcript_29580/g.53745 Transcript_29580/m.53745 type:complete len:199 (+) Transcript_29580:73-669(+)|eukprot:CAMPEP_0197658444 /NCGR_PEP_ID=MMETSP1338-20131121/45241_1 /TAXON_ID=43686 ORGANISM="Pelagodinium beii, Strain RCC1491" /NCGR_SAMPLE_ID=MMETSP1338 /ASSEMBLY_ACC=CAM_ASM_000754 /LENGTH=198 /DNA_ID=CAMNT_0043235035 /DNA_START=68 /DNA_END=664 /DNA_ORIENTATION=+
MGKLLTATSLIACMLVVVQSTGRSLRGVPPSSPSPAFTLGENLQARDFEPYPGYAGKLVVTGTVQLAQEGSGADATQVMTFTLAGTEEACGTANVTGIANACGINIDVGKNCSDASTVGGHFWNRTAIAEDPWQNVMYATVHLSAFEDGLKVTTGLSNAEIADHVLVVHDVSGARIACSPVTMTIRNPHLSDRTQAPP